MRVILWLTAFLVICAGLIYVINPANAATYLGKYPNYLKFGYPEKSATVPWVEIHCLTHHLNGTYMLEGEVLTCWYQGGKSTECLVIGPPDHLSCKELD